MPVKIQENQMFRIRDLKVEFDKDTPALTMNPGKSETCVICVCKRGAVEVEDLELSERNLSVLFTGGTLEFPEKGYTLQGVTRNALAASPRFRNFKMKPPAYVQVWGMSNHIDGTLLLHVPADAQEQCVLVPVGYRLEQGEGYATVWIQTVEGYEDGDLEYRVENHLAVPIPRSALNNRFPLAPGVSITVEPREECAPNYVMK